MIAADPPVASSPVLDRYRSFRRLPGGARAFDLALAAFAPFNAVLGVHVAALDPGHARTEMRESALRRNHLGTVHAVALSGLAEVTGNLAVASMLPAGASFVVRSFAITFEHPARGAVRAECRVPESFLVADRAEVDLETILRDAWGRTLARATARVRVRIGRRS